MSEKELQEVIKKLEALRDEAFHKSNHTNAVYSANRNGQYTAYHKAIEIIKKAQKGEWLV
jgi:hypothetical protein